MRTEDALQQRLRQGSARSTHESGLFVESNSESVTDADTTAPGQESCDEMFEVEGDPGWLDDDEPYRYDDDNDNDDRLIEQPILDNFYQ
jgi:hypothetical protein